MYICTHMGNKTTYILQLILGITGFIGLCTHFYIVGILLLIGSYFVYKNKLKPIKSNWTELYNSQNRAGKRKMKRGVVKSVLGKQKFR